MNPELKESIISTLDTHLNTEWSLLLKLFPGITPEAISMLLLGTILIAFTLLGFTTWFLVKHTRRTRIYSNTAKKVLRTGNDADKENAEKVLAQLRKIPTGVGAAIFALFALLYVAAVIPAAAPVMKAHYQGTPDNSCPVYQTDKDGKPIIRTVKLVGPDLKPILKNGNEQFEKVALKWAYKFRLQDIQATPNGKLQIKYIQPELFGEDYHLCSFDLAKPENRQMQQQLQKLVEQMKRREGVKALSKMSERQQQQMARQMRKQEGGQKEAEEARKRLEGLQQQMQAMAKAEAEAQKGKDGQQGQGQQGQPGEGQLPNPGDSVSMSLPSSDKDMEWLRDHGIDAKKEKENAPDNPNRPWEFTAGGNDFKLENNRDFDKAN